MSRQFKGNLQRKCYVSIFSRLKPNYIWQMHGYPQFSFCILIALAKICFSRIVINCAKIPWYQEALSLTLLVYCSQPKLIGDQKCLLLGLFTVQGKFFFSSLFLNAFVHNGVQRLTCHIGIFISINNNLCHFPIYILLYFLYKCFSCGV